MKKLFVVLLILAVVGCTPVQSGRLTVVDKALGEEMELCFFDTAQPEKGEQCRTQTLQDPLRILILEQCPPGVGCFEMEVLSDKTTWEACQIGDTFTGTCASRIGQ